MRLLRLVLSIALVALPLRAVADTPVPQAPLELTGDNLASVLDPVMMEWVDKYKGPGAVVVVVKRNGPVFAKGYGYSDIDAKTSFTADKTLVRPGSISKLFTGIAVMQLVDEGKLDLDRDVNDYLEFSVSTPEGGVPVTLRRLLRHRAGFEEHVKGLFSRDREPEPLGRSLAKNLPTRLFPKGDVVAYSNYGVALAGYIVERASGEPYAAYIQRHILEPLGMAHSTFQQPLPDSLAALMAKGYHTSDAPPLGYFETIPVSPAGALSATGTDMGRFISMLINGGALDGVRILPKARLDEMIAASDGTPAGYLGLVFHGSKIAGHDAIGHTGGTLAFLSDLTIFPGQEIGVFVSLDGRGKITKAEEIPDPTRLIATRFLLKAPEGAHSDNAGLPADAGITGVYHWSRRAESNFTKLLDLISEGEVRVDRDGAAKLLPAIWPFGEGKAVKRVGNNLYEGPRGMRATYVSGNGFDSYFATPAMQAQRVPWSLDVRWIAPAFLASATAILITLPAWPITALWRRWRKRPNTQDAGERRGHLIVRLVLVVDAVVIFACSILFALSTDPTIFNEALDPLVLGIYALAWLGVLGAIPTVWIAARSWIKHSGGRWLRVHHSLIAASTVMIAWFFVTFHVAGTTLNY